MISYDDYTDAVLLDFVKDDDQRAFAVLYERHRMEVYEHAYLFYQDYDKAQDVIQDVFTKLWQSRESINVKSNFAGYLHTMVRNGILNKLAREETAQKYISYSTYTQERSSLAVDEYMAEKELTAILARKIDKLPRKMKEVFILSREENLSHQEISERLQISSKTVRQQIYNALLLIKSGLKYVLIFFI